MKTYPMSTNNSPSNIIKFWYSGMSLGITLVFFFVIILAYSIKIPSAYLNFYAEDSSYFQTALDVPFPSDLFLPASGYQMLVSRIIGRFISIFPLNIIPIVNFITVCFVISLLCTVTWKNISYYVNNNFLKLILCLSLILLPILNFEVMASSCGLHFLLLFPTVLIMLNFRNGRDLFGLDICIMVLAILSDPMSIFCTIALLQPFRCLLRRSADLFTKYIYSLIISCIAIQMLFTLYGLSMGIRTISHGGSFLKTIYLYLDRVVGSSIIPNWGFVNSSDLVLGSITSNLILRGALAVSVVFLLIYFAHYLWNNNRSIDSDHKLRVDIPLLLASSLLYWLFVGYLFNPEPRYAIFPGLCLITIILIMFDIFIETGKAHNSRLRKGSIFFVSALFFSTWVFSFTPSSLRAIGPTWESELLTARYICNNSNIEIVKLRVLPLSSQWFVSMKCIVLSK